MLEYQTKHGAQAEPEAKDARGGIQELKHGEKQ